MERSSTCPGCGAAMEFQTETVQRRHGTCGACHTAFVISEGVPYEQGVPARAPDERADTSDGADDAEIPCLECGEALVVSAGSSRQFEMTCTGCGANFSYELSRDRDERPFPRRPGGAGEYRPREGFGRPAARPCRKCGGRIEFSTGPDGATVGTCSSCGNTFSLAPKEERSERGPPYRRGSARDGPPRRGSGGGWKRDSSWRGRPGARSDRPPGRRPRRRREEE